MQSQSVQADQSLCTSFIVGVVCANLNAKHPGYNFQQMTF